MSVEQQKSEQHHGGDEAGGSRLTTQGEQQAFTAFDQQRALTVNLMEQVCDPMNIVRAYRRVRSNKGSPGVDGMTVHALADWLREHQAALTASLLDGSYQPRPVRGVQIPKPGGGKRQLGIPVAVDRLVQQMILQVLNPILDPTFSNSSYGFRPEGALTWLWNRRGNTLPGRGASLSSISTSKSFSTGFSTISSCPESRAESVTNAFFTSSAASCKRV